MVDIEHVFRRQLVHHRWQIVAEQAIIGIEFDRGAVTAMFADVAHGVTTRRVKVARRAHLIAFSHLRGMRTTEFIHVAVVRSVPELDRKTSYANLMRSFGEGEIMPYVATNYDKIPAAPEGKWVCAPGSTKGPFDTAPNPPDSEGPNYCGQCVSYVKHACPDLPKTTQWRRGGKVKTSSNIAAGTAIATFDDDGHYKGHAAIYVSQDAINGILVWDQYRTGNAPKAVGPRRIKWGPAPYISNDGDRYYIIERMQ